MRLMISIAAAFLMTACAATGPTTYGAASNNEFGYTQTQIEDDRYRIIYRGSGGMPPEMVEDYALRRAAELTVTNGYDWFRVIGLDLTEEERGGVSLGAGLGTGSYGRRGGVNVGVGGNVGRVGAKRYYTARLEVLMGEGEAPDDGNVYDAASIINQLSGSDYGRAE